MTQYVQPTGRYAMKYILVYTYILNLELWSSPNSGIIAWGSQKQHRDMTSWAVTKKWDHLQLSQKSEVVPYIKFIALTTHTPVIKDLYLTKFAEILPYCCKENFP